MNRQYVALAGLLALAACSKPDNAPGPGGVTMGEARALDDAAAMLDGRRAPPVDATTATRDNAVSPAVQTAPAAAPIH